MLENVKQIVHDVLGNGYLMSLATVDGSGPWVADVIYIHDDNLSIYWMSDPDARHSQALLQNNQVAGTITISGQGEDNLGIQFEGVAEKIDGDRYDLVTKHYKKRKKPNPERDEDVLNGDSWYVVRPSKIELICERLYGFKKQKLEL
ncbi:MAG: pyridoxamine 5'-phosphate oxidase family protein [Candidatus Andersenbacteria bacterium]